MEDSLNSRSNIKKRGFAPSALIHFKSQKCSNIKFTRAKVFLLCSCLLVSNCLRFSLVALKREFRSSSYGVYPVHWATLHIFDILYIFVTTPKRTNWRFLPSLDIRTRLTIKFIFVYILPISEKYRIFFVYKWLQLYSVQYTYICAE